MARLSVVPMLVLSLCVFLSTTKADAAFHCGGSNVPPRYTCACTPGQYWDQYGYYAYTPEDSRHGQFDPTCPGQGQCLGWRCFSNQWFNDMNANSVAYMREYPGNLMACAKHPYGACLILKVDQDCNW